MRLASILFLFISISVFAQDKEQWSRVELRNKVSLSEYNYFPWRSTISSEKKASFFGTLLDLIDSGVVQVYRPEPPYTLPLNAKEIHQLLYRYDTAAIMDNETMDMTYQVVRTRINWENIESVVFNETWTCDPVTSKFIKKVNGMVVEQTMTDNYSGMYMGKKPLFYLAFNMKSVRQPDQLKANPLVLYHATENKYNWYNTDDNPGTHAEKMFSLLTPFVNGNSAFYDTVFPYTAKLSKDRCAEVLANKKFISDYYFSEIWSFDASSFIFKKDVCGILYTTRIGNATRPSTFIPLNGLEPQALINSEKVYPGVNFIHQVLFQPSPEYDPSPYRSPLSGEDSVKLAQYTKEIAEKVFKKQIPGYEQYGNSYFTLANPERSLLDKTEIDHIFIRRDSVGYETEGPYMYKIIEQNLIDRNVSGFLFYERWNFNPTIGEFHKQIKAIGNLYNIEDQNGEFRYWKSPYLILNNTGSPGNPTPLSANIKYQCAINSMNEHPREDTIMVGEFTTEEPFHLDPLDRYRIVQGLIDACVQGKLTAIDPKTEKPVKKKEILPLLKTYYDSTCIKGHLENEFRLTNYLEFEENWYRYSGTVDLSKEVLSVTLIRKTAKYDTSHDKWIYTDQKLLTIPFKPKKK